MLVLMPINFQNLIVILIATKRTERMIGELMIFDLLITEYLIIRGIRIFFPSICNKREKFGG